MKQTLRQQLRMDLLRWYDQHGRDLPWRAKHPNRANPYHVWLSEMMLQQTTVVTVIPYFNSFLEKWPTLTALSQSTQDEILVAWQGLGYYARARNLYKCAQTIMEKYGGNFPQEREELAKLPGIGPYISGAIASIAFNQAVVPIDGNVKRVLTRLFALKTALSEKTADGFAGSFRPGDFAQALMDLGARVCLPKNPQCDQCPWTSHCLAFQEGNPTCYPHQELKKTKPTKYTIAFIMIDPQQRILLRKRPESGLLAGLYEIPTTQWSIDQLQVGQEGSSMLQQLENPYYKGSIKHTFTHFHLKVDVYVAHTRSVEKLDHEIWVGLKELDRIALPTLMKKAISLASSELAQIPQHRGQPSCETETYKQPVPQRA